MKKKQTIHFSLPPAQHTIPPAPNSVSYRKATVRIGLPPKPDSKQTIRIHLPGYPEQCQTSDIRPLGGNSSSGGVSRPSPIVVRPAVRQSYWIDMMNITATYVGLSEDGKQFCFSCNGGMFFLNQYCQLIRVAKPLKQGNAPEHSRHTVMCVPAPPNPPAPGKFPPVLPPAAPVVESNRGIVSRLQKLKQLYEIKMISEEEYALKKTEILREI